MAHGGKREGAGAKPTPKETHKVMVSMKFKPSIVAFLATCSNKTATVEAAIEATPEFKAWAKSNGQ